MPFEMPFVLSTPSTGPIVLGMRFSTAVAGDVVAFRYFKSSAENGGAHTGKLYDTASNRLLASTATFEDVFCRDAVWVSVAFTTPVRLSPNTVYMIVLDAVTSYSRTDNGLAAPKANGDLTALGSVYGRTPGAVPTLTDQATTSYFLDGESGATYY
jgi:hypothetical protein